MLTVLELLSNYNKRILPEQFLIHSGKLVLVAEQVYSPLSTHMHLRSTKSNLASCHYALQPSDRIPGPVCQCLMLSHLSPVITLGSEQLAGATNRP